MLFNCSKVSYPLFTRYKLKQYSSYHPRSEGSLDKDTWHSPTVERKRQTTTFRRKRTSVVIIVVDVLRPAVGTVCRRRSVDVRSSGIVEHVLRHSGPRDVDEPGRCHLAVNLHHRDAANRRLHCLCVVTFTFQSTSHHSRISLLWLISFYIYYNNEARL